MVITDEKKVEEDIEEEATEPQRKMIKSYLGHSILTKGDNERMMYYIQSIIPDPEDISAKGARQFLGKMAIITAGTWHFPCSEKLDGWLISKSLKKAFRHLTQFEICKNWCPFGLFADPECKIWKRRYDAKDMRK